MLCICSKTYFCYDVALNKLNFCSEDINELVLEHSGDGPFDKYYPILDEKKLILLQQTEVFAQTITLLLRMNK